MTLSYQNIWMQASMSKQRSQGDANDSQRSDSSQLVKKGMSAEGEQPPGEDGREGRWARYWRGPNRR